LTVQGVEATLNGVHDHANKITIFRILLVPFFIVEVL